MIWTLKHKQKCTAFTALYLATTRHTIFRGRGMFKIQSIAPSLASDQKHNKQSKERSGGSERGQGTHEQQAQSMANQTLRHCLLNEVPKRKRGKKAKKENQSAAILPPRTSTETPPSSLMKAGCFRPCSFSKTSTFPCLHSYRHTLCVASSK